ncbi:hypothetical protein TUM4438_25280 [Shewanella sairae]|uniref:AbrB/MazE/SpoVT family DNA-binding domain-containing protein n=1 Tax=Shewanella sairae TaxID=190310 RepID=A0ABQ4PI79_9GAMM|nr:AbrB/MazE/SpoVT family DNA-binding domain-containing protein [Shewanella sairae]MCL1131363.1 AbrB/MazE/SpoVT family DNA-binding domain-containing protein [Shewanella sairae]GIU47139.1 hypothetical protein TUM4438_25280 [Shewanella sairae]
MAEIKVEAIGEGLGLRLPSEIVEQLHVQAGDRISLEKMPHGSYRLVTIEDKLAEQMTMIEDFMHEEDA